MFSTLTQKIEGAASTISDMASSVTRSDATAADTSASSGPSEPSKVPDMIIQEDFTPLKECDLEPKTNVERDIINPILRLYAYDTNSRYIDALTDDVEFEDPISFGKGKENVVSLFNSLHSLFSDSQTVSSEIVSQDVDKVTFNLKQLYTLKGLGTKKEMDSTIDVSLRDGKVARIEERWNNQPLRRKESSMDVVGMVAEKWRLFAGKLVGAVVSSAPQPRTE